MELREYVRACRRRWVWIVVPILLAMGAAAGLSLTQEPAYRSSMVLFVTTGSGDPDAKASRLNSYIALLTGPRVAQNVVAKMGPPLTTERVQESLTAEVQAGTDLLVVTATDPSAARSKTMVTNATSALVALAKKLDPPTTTADSGPPPQITIAQDAVTTQEPGNLARNIGFSAVLGLLVGGVGVAVREATRKTVAEEDDLRRLGIGTVGVISLSGRWARKGQADSAIAEAFRRLRSLLPADVTEKQAASARGTTLLLTAANPKEGTTAVACGLAIALAETGARVLLVDGNLRSPGVGRYLSMDAGPGLADVLAGRARVSDVLRDPLGGRLTVLPPGEKRPDPGEVLSSPRLAATFGELAGRFDVVLVDAPPLHTVADATVLSKVTDGALLVVRAGRTRTADVRRSTDLLERVGARLVGAVLNALPRRLPDTRAAAPAITEPIDSPGLVTTLLGTPAHDEPQPPANPVSGRARVDTDVSQTALATWRTADIAHKAPTDAQSAAGPAYGTNNNVQSTGGTAYGTSNNVQSTASPAYGTNNNAQSAGGTAYGTNNNAQRSPGTMHAPDTDVQNPAGRDIQRPAADDRDRTQRIIPVRPPEPEDVERTQRIPIQSPGEHDGDKVQRLTVTRTADVEQRAANDEVTVQQASTSRNPGAPANNAQQATAARTSNDPVNNAQQASTTRTPNDPDNNVQQANTTRTPNDPDATVQQVSAARIPDDDPDKTAQQTATARNPSGPDNNAQPTSTTRTPNDPDATVQQQTATRTPDGRTVQSPATNDPDATVQQTTAARNPNDPDATAQQTTAARNPNDPDATAQQTTAARSPDEEDDGDKVQRLFPVRPRGEDDGMITQRIVPPVRADRAAVSLNGHGKAVVQGKAAVAEDEPTEENGHE
ncbi:polysaccharide biosynthesis tyrosine autokinase [Actinoplanes bogorensis]|uniref:Polysaccharide biosynthesis tyrosine autokinase n=1 Tax=Paractinoplanes bogorensis TaxID=1610840 RepID=A0ABS5YTP6_9ACTN|nr:polysaccharide biosynthesis tyrosine autokinase [Actinoplanes bogorensis]MBU2666827.1 polysaccharide biosynthesis tyrosine autokinase [Actinoplanes bogorensis]